MACSEVLSASPMEITIEDYDGLGNDLVISPDDQLGEAQISLTTQFFQQFTQASVFTCQRKRQGVESQAVIDLTSYDDLELFAASFGTTVIEDGTDATKKKVLIRDDVGAAPVTKKIIFKPAEGGVGTTNANRWITYPNGQIVENTSQMTFGNNSQVSFPVTLYAAPDDQGLRVIRGDETAVAA